MSAATEKPADIASVVRNESDAWDVSLVLPDGPTVTLACLDKVHAELLAQLINDCSWFEVTP